MAAAFIEQFDGRPFALQQNSAKRPEVVWAERHGLAVKLANLKVGKYNRAIKDFNEVIRREPSSPKGYQLREVAYQLKGTHN